MCGKEIQGQGEKVSVHTTLSYKVATDTSIKYIISYCLITCFYDKLVGPLLNI